MTLKTFLKSIFLKKQPRPYIPKHKSWIISNPYNIPVHDQGNINNCTSHAFALMLEYKLSERLKERVTVDVDDLWEKQKKFGTATDEGDILEGSWNICEVYGVVFKTDSGKIGTYFLGGRIVWN